jgi:hypothetical protein
MRVWREIGLAIIFGTAVQFLCSCSSTQTSQGDNNPSAAQGGATPAPSNPQGGPDQKTITTAITQGVNSSFQHVYNFARAGAPKEVKGLVDVMQTQGNDQRVYSNMCALENAVVDYSSQHGGQFPPVINNFMNDSLAKQFNKNSSLFFKRFDPDHGIVNPYTNNAEWPKLGSMDDVTAARNGNPPAIPPGSLEYCYGGSQNSYVIMGGGRDGKALTDTVNPGKTLMRTSGQ